MHSYYTIKSNKRNNKELFRFIYLFLSFIKMLYNLFLYFFLLFYNLNKNVLLRRARLLAQNIDGKCKKRGTCSNTHPTINNAGFELIIIQIFMEL
jgi:hypothetical protein